VGGTAGIDAARAAGGDAHAAAPKVPAIFSMREKSGSHRLRPRKSALSPPVGATLGWRE
jgi:hypothetical protein